MGTDDSYRLLAVTAQCLRDLSAYEAEDLITSVAPDSVCLPGRGGAYYGRQFDQLDVDVSVLTLQPGHAERHDTPVGDLLVTSRLDDAAMHEALATGPARAVLTDTVEYRTDKDRLETERIGFEPFTDHETTVLSYGIDGGHTLNWDGTRIYGLDPSTGRGSSTVSVLTLYPDRTKLTEVRLDRLGLRAVHGVGASVAERLTRQGIDTVDDLCDASVSTLLEIRGIGQATAEALPERARAVRDGEVVRQTDARLPPDPLVIDIETDGLSPSVIWQIGALDTRTDEYHAFVQRDPTAEGVAVSEFCDWLATRDGDQPVVAYHGWGFDFIHLRTFIERYVPEHTSTWFERDLIDPLQWANDDGNAILPGRSNRLEDVTAALGYERAETGLDGAATAHAYQRWQDNPSDETELDWARHEQYCEDDVRSLAMLYDALQSSGRLLGETVPPTGQDSTQGSLSDF
jgi:transcription termination factor NusA